RLSPNASPVPRSHACATSCGSDPCSPATPSSAGLARAAIPDCLRLPRSVLAPAAALASLLANAATTPTPTLPHPIDPSSLDALAYPPASSPDQSPPSPAPLPAALAPARIPPDLPHTPPPLGSLPTHCVVFAPAQFPPAALKPAASAAPALDS